jgi:hypothetical protein
MTNRPIRLPGLAAAALLATLFASSPAGAQIFGIGIQGGGAMDASRKFESNGLKNPFLEASFRVTTEPGVNFRMRISRMELDSPDKSVSPDCQVEKIGMDVEYQVSRGYYKAGFFLGGGYYRFRSDEDRLPAWDDGEDHFGFYGGITGWFRISDDFAIVPEISLERIPQGEPRTFGRAGIGLDFSF